MQHNGIVETQLTNLHNKPNLPPRILPHQDSSNIPQDLVDTAEHHGRHEPPSFIVPTQEDLDKDAYCVQGDEDTTRGERWAVSVDAGLDRAGRDRAIGVVAVVDVPGAVGGDIC